MNAMSETWILYKTETSDAEGWEARQLLPTKSLTDILWENLDYSGKLPQVGDRVRQYSQNPETGSVTHAREGDWVVSHIHQFSSFDTDQRVVVCYCQYQPIVAEWQSVKRGQAVHEMLKANAVQCNDLTPNP